MKKYPPEVLKLLGECFSGNKQAYDELAQRGGKELLLLLAYIIDGKDEAFELLKKDKHYVLAAFLKAYDKERNSLKFLLDARAAEWAAIANYLNGDRKAKDWLVKNGFQDHAELADKMFERIKKEKEDSDFNAIINPL